MASKDALEALMLGQKYSSYRLYFFAFIAGFIALFAFSPFDFIPFLFISYAILFYLGYSHRYDIKRTIIVGQAYGFGYFLGGLYWVGNALLVDPSQFLIFTPLAYIGLPFGLSLFYLLALLLVRLVAIRTTDSKIIYFIYMAIILSCFDGLRSFIFTGFPWNIPLYATAFSDMLMQPTYYLGPYIYNSLIVFIALSFGLYFFIKKRSIVILALIECSLLGGLCLVGDYRLNNLELIEQDDYIFRIIQPNIAQNIRWEEHHKYAHFEKLKRLTLKARIENKKYIFIWPETSLPLHPEYNENIFTELQNIIGAEDHLVFGKLKFITKKIGGNYDVYNSAYHFTRDRGLRDIYDKVHLVPFGEYLPLSDYLQYLGLKQVSHFQKNFSAGDLFKSFKLDEDLSAAVLICYESIFPTYAEKMKAQNIDLLFILTNDAWFGHSSGPYQHFTKARFRAIENEVMILRSANTGISAVIDPLGRVLQTLSLNREGYMDTRIIKVRSD